MGKFSERYWYYYHRYEREELGAFESQVELSRMARKATDCGAVSMSMVNWTMVPASAKRRKIGEYYALTELRSIHSYSRARSFDDLSALGVLQPF